MDGLDLPAQSDLAFIRSFGGAEKRARKFSSEDLHTPARRIDPRILPMVCDHSQLPRSFLSRLPVREGARSEPRRLQPMIPLIIYAWQGSPLEHGVP